LVIEGLAAMMLAEVGDFDVARYLSEGRVAPPYRHVEWGVGGPHEAGGRYEAESAPGQGLGQNGPGNGLDAPPLVGLEKKARGQREL
jgi:hypothetical protein